MATIGCAKSWKNPRIEIDEDPPKIPDVIVLHKEFEPDGLQKSKYFKWVLI